MGETFDWTYPGLNSSHFYALANLLSLRNGGQAEHSSSSELVLDEDGENPDDDEDGNAPSVHTTLVHQISDSGYGPLERWFVAASKKGGTAVACFAMKEAEDSVVQPIDLKLYGKRWSRTIRIEWNIVILPI